MPKPTTTTIGRPAALFGAALGFFLSAASPVSADDRRGERDDQRHGKQVVQLPKTGERCADDPKCHNRWHPAIPPVKMANSGDVVVFGTRDAFDHSPRPQLDGGRRRRAQPESRSSVDRPVVRQRSSPGRRAGGHTARHRAGQVRLHDRRAGLRISPRRVSGPVHRPLGSDAPRRDVAGHSRSESPVRRLHGNDRCRPGAGADRNLLSTRSCIGRGRRVRVAAASRSMHCRAEVCGPTGSSKDRCLRTIPPRENGGNMDIKQMQVGTTLLLPCFIAGCLLSIGDVHFAQGDGEVSGTAIEMDATVTVKVEVIKGLGAQVTQPQFRGGDAAEAARAEEISCHGRLSAEAEGPDTAHPCLSGRDEDRAAHQSLRGRNARRPGRVAADGRLARDQQRTQSRAGVLPVERRGGSPDRQSRGHAQFRGLGDPRPRRVRPPSGR